MSTKTSFIAMSILLMAGLLTWTETNGSVVSLNKANIDERIYNGERVTDRTQFPYQVYLRFKEANPRKFHGCGGSLITANWVLTAAHCCYDPHDGTAIFGTLASHMENGGQRIDFTNDDIHIHENYQDAHNFDDICLVKMPQEVQLSDKVGIIDLLDNDNADPDTYVDQMATIAGWGYTDDNKVASEYLRTATDAIISTEDCKHHFRDVTSNNICTSKETSGTCKGDSGGPLTIEVDGTTKQIGLTSFGHPRCSKPDPSVFTYVPAYADWIKKTMDDNN